METRNALEKQIKRKIAEGSTSSALALTELLCELEPDVVEWQVLHLEVLFAEREYDNVLRIVENFLVGYRLDKKVVTYGLMAAFELGNLQLTLYYCDVLNSIELSPTALCYQGKCAELSEDAQKAVECYQQALSIDPCCGDALNALIERRLVNPEELVRIIDGLALPSELEVVREYHRARVGGVVAGTHGGGAVGVPKALRLMQSAQSEYASNNLRRALTHTTELLRIDPYSRPAVCLHLTVLVDLKDTAKLFEVAHFLSKNKPHADLAVYAIGCFYYSLANYERAGRYFSRATELDYFFVEAWIAYGHCYTKLEEGEQALSVYRKVMSSFPGVYQCYRFIGMQYSRILQWPVAMNFLQDAHRAAPRDTLVLNEIGVLYVRVRRLSEARHFLQLAYDNLPCPEIPSEYEDCILFNLATVLRRTGDLEQALKYYMLYIRCRPNAAHGHCALGFTYHLLGNIPTAISHYYTALNIKTDSFCQRLLARALSTEFTAPLEQDAREGRDTRSSSSSSSSGSDSASLSDARTLQPQPQRGRPTSLSSVGRALRY